MQKCKNMSSSLSVENFGRTCRACLSTNHDQELRPLSDESVLESFTKFTSLEVSKDDRLPQHICSRCLDKCETSTAFKEACVNNESFLLIILTTSVRRQQEEQVATAVDTNHTPVAGKPRPTTEQELDGGNLPEAVVEPKRRESCRVTRLGSKRRRCGDESTRLVDIGHIDELHDGKKSDVEDAETLEWNKRKVVGSTSNRLRTEREKVEQQPGGVETHKITCQYCGKLFDSAIPLENHIRKTHSKETTHSCLECGAIYMSLPGLRKHMYKHSAYQRRPKNVVTEKREKLAVVPLRQDDSNVKCLCGIIFRTTSSFSSHFKGTHNNETNYSCPVCDATIVSAYQIKNHLFEHSDFRFLCTNCDELLQSPYLYHRHQLKTHPKHMCDVCGATAINQSQLDEHSRSHTGDRPYACNVCGKMFKSKPTLQRHSVVHSEKSFHCDSCSGSFHSKPRLLMHVKKMHSDRGRSHICSVCGKGYISPSELRLHMRLHTGEKPFKCPLCPATFRRSHKMKEHQSLHSGEKPHVCEICHKSFRVMWTLKVHLRTHNKT